jgi:hypothetical protein
MEKTQYQQILKRAEQKLITGDKLTDIEDKILTQEIRKNSCGDSNINRYYDSPYDRY